MCTAWYGMVLLDPHWFDSWSRSVIHLTAIKTLEDHRNVSDVLSKLRDVQQKKLDVGYYSKTFVCLQESTCPALSQCWMREIVQRAAVSVDAQQASLGWITSSFLLHILQDQLTWTAWLRISFVLTTSARMILDYRLAGSNAKLLTLTMCQWLCYSVNVWHGECDEPDGGNVIYFCDAW